MARPRTLSRSTKVVAEGHGDRKHKKSNRKKQNKARSKQDVTWDHDDSNPSDDEPESTNARAPSGRKRPRQDGTACELPAEGAVVKQTSERHPKAYSEAASTGGGGDVDFDTAPNDSGGEVEGVAEDQEDAMGGDEESPAATQGGMGDVMAKILGQRLDSKSKAPVLAKRKTKTMKEMEEAAAKREENRGKSAARRAKLTQQFVIPDHTTTDYERQLKKIATRGVVALFNAINKRQHQTSSVDGDTGNEKGVAGTAKAAAVKSASRNAFLNMLKTGVKPESATERSTSGSAKPGKGGNGEAVEEDGARSWSVLKEDYMMGGSSMKNWDQESAESELDALGGADMMSDDEGSD